MNAAARFVLGLILASAPLGVVATAPEDLESAALFGLSYVCALIGMARANADRRRRGGGR